VRIENASALPAAKLALLAKSVKKPTNHAAQKRQKNEAKRKMHWTLLLGSVFRLSAIWAFNWHDGNVA
jgi:hypothetical protein